MAQLLIATKNPHKVQEMRELLQDTPYEILSPDDRLPDVEETATTYEGNATLKAVHYAKFTGIPSIADDSGLEVDALEGAPGIHSARWSGVEGKDRYEANNRKLIECLQDISSEKRTARFVSVIVLADPEQVLLCCRGECAGRITFQPRGSEGFGYDPLFEVPEYNKTFAELGPEIKNKIGHRARALEAFKRELVQICFPGTQVVGNGDAQKRKGQ